MDTFSQAFKDEKEEGTPSIIEMINDALQKIDLSNFVEGENMEQIHMYDEDLYESLDDACQRVSQEEDNLVKTFRISPSTAKAIQYLRTRKYWTKKKELLLITRDQLGLPVNPHKILTGELNE